MADYLILLPNDATTWMFSPSETFFCALTPVIQTDMLQFNFIMVALSRDELKMEQPESLNNVYVSAITSRERNFITHNAISQHAEATLSVTTPEYQSASVHHTAAITGFESFNRGINLASLTDGDINTYAYGNANTAQTNMYKSQAEKQCNTTTKNIELQGVDQVSPKDSCNSLS